MPEKHALLSASASSRWLHCTRAPRTEEKLPEKTSVYAEEGRLAHAIAELKLRKKFFPMKPSEFNKQMKKLKADPVYQEEMQRYTDVYLDYISELAMAYKSKPYIAVEVQVDYSNIAPEGFGTADCILIGDDTLEIVDFKYGQGVPVDAKENPQMRLYAIGALMKYFPIYGASIENVRMSIVQPRLDSITEERMSQKDLLNWGALEVRPKAELAFKGEGDFTPGTWCKFCRARDVCKPRAQSIVGGAEGIPHDDPDFLTDAELGDYLTRAHRLKQWISDIDDYALTAVLQGRAVPGWKAVEGRSIRRMNDLDKAFAVLQQNGYPEAALYERVPLTLTKLESLVGKKELGNLCGDYIIKPPGKPALVPDSDKRPAYNSAAADFAGVADI